jgi:hypothetical protein
MEPVGWTEAKKCALSVIAAQKFGTVQLYEDEVLNSEVPCSVVFGVTSRAYEQLGANRRSPRGFAGRCQRRSTGISFG